MQPKQACKDVFAEPQDFCPTKGEKASCLLLDRINAADDNSIQQPRNAQEHCHVLHEGAKIEDRNQDGEERAPHAGPEIKRHELQVRTNRKVIDHQCVSEEGAGRT